MGVNRVTLNTPDGEETIMDITDTTATPETVAEGVVFYGADGEQQTGTALGGIPVPETATVGQTVVVKTVDENGKPTEWEVVELPEGLPNPDEMIQGQPLVPFHGDASGDIPGTWGQDAFIPASAVGQARQSVRWTGEFDENGNHIWEGYFPVVAPAYPEIGQTIVVSAVDEWGHPTEWKATDLPTGGGVTGNVVKPADLREYTPKHYLSVAGILSTQDGTALPSIGSGTWSSVAYGDAVMMMIASGTNVAAMKVDGCPWTSTTLPKSAQWTDIAYGNGFFVAIARGDSEFAVFDGAEWELVDTGVTANWTSIVWSGTEFIVTQDGTTGYGAMVCSGDPYNDLQYVSTVPPAYKALCVNGKYYLLGSAALYVSDDIWSGAWTDNSVDGVIEWMPTDVVYGDGLFVGVDDSSYVYYSADFITWSDPIPVVLADGSVPQIPYIGYCNGQFVALPYQHYWGATATAGEIQNGEFYGEFNLAYQGYVHWVKSIGHQVVILRDSVDEVPSYWYFDGGENVGYVIDIITPPSGGEGTQGPQGEQGPAGEDGYTPVKGVDYWTEEDKAEMLADVIAALPVYNGEVEDV